MLKLHPEAQHQNTQFPHLEVAISRVTILITHIRGLITPLITTLTPKPLNPKPYSTVKEP